MAPREDLEQLAPSLARERTELAWSRTAIAFAAVGGGLLKTSVAAGAVVVAMGLLVWGVCRIFPVTPSGRVRSGRLLTVTVTVTAVALVALAVAVFGHQGSVHLGSVHGASGHRASGHALPGTALPGIRVPGAPGRLSLTAPLRAHR